MLNKVMIIGRLGRDPELKYTASGMAICNLNIATDESYLDRDGAKVEKTEWHRAVVFQRQAENCANYLAKGSLIYIEGKLETRKWQDQQGNDKYSTEIKATRVQFLDRKKNNEEQQEYSQQHRGNQEQYHDDGYGNGFPSEAAGMQDVPF